MVRVIVSTFILCLFFQSAAAKSVMNPEIRNGWEDEGIPVFEFLKGSYAFCKTPFVKKGCSEKKVNMKKRHTLSQTTSALATWPHVHVAKKEFSFSECPQIKLKKGQKVVNKGYLAEGSFSLRIKGQVCEAYIDEKFSDRLTGFPIKKRVEHWIRIEAVDGSKGWVKVTKNNFKEVDRVF